MFANVTHALSEMNVFSAHHKDHTSLLLNSSHMLSALQSRPAGISTLHSRLRECLQRLKTQVEYPEYEKDELVQVTFYDKVSHV